MTCLVESQFIDSTVGVLYTNTANKSARIDFVEIHNTDTVTRTVTFHIVASGGAPGPVTVRVITPATAGATVIVRELIGHDLSQNDTLQGLCDAPGVVSIRVSGRLVSN